MTRIITAKTMTCKTCDTTFEYEDKELIPIPAYPCMAQINCPKCGQQIIMIADEFKEANKIIVVEDDYCEKEKQN